MPSLDPSFWRRHCPTTDDESVAGVLEVLPSAESQFALLAMLQTIDERLTAQNIPYWVTAGTLLGAVRHGGLIPHDDDLDIELLESDVPRAKAALGSIGRSFREAGFWSEDNVPIGRFYFWANGGSGMYFDMSSTASSIQHPTSNIQHPTSNLQHPTCST